MITRYNITNQVVKKINEVTKQYSKEKKRFTSFFHFRKNLIEEIRLFIIDSDLGLIEQEIVIVNNKTKNIDLVIYDKSDFLLSIEFCWKFIGISIAKLNSIKTNHRLLISVYPDPSLAKNMIKRLDPKSKIQLLHLSNIEFINDSKSPSPKVNSHQVIDSPLEIVFEKKLKEYHLDFQSQYGVYQKSVWGRTEWTPKYIVDFMVKGEFCKIAVECDGLYYHLRDTQRAYDTERNLWLINHGFDNVLRFYGDEIRNDLDGCINSIIDDIRKWDNYYRRKAEKKLVTTKNIKKDQLCKEDVINIVKEITPTISSLVKRVKEKELKENLNKIIKNINKTILKIGYSNEIQRLYFSFPELSKTINHVHGMYIGYNVPFIVHVISPVHKKDIPDYLKYESSFLKVIILLKKEVLKIENLKHFVIINGDNGRVILSDIIGDYAAREDIMSKKKYYVVWSGNKTGIFETWDECKKQVIGVKGAKYKSFSTKPEADTAFKTGNAPSIHRKKEISSSKQLSLLDESKYITESISVDAACSGNPGMMEYKGVYTKNGKEIFHYGPVPNGTNNIGEFLAIVHALALLKQKNSNLPIYSDSKTAISWIRKQEVNTKLPRDKSTEHLWKVIDRAKKWLHTNTFNNEVLKWETHLWGESKADFGRK